MHPNIYLFFNGNCFEAMALYAKVLGGEIISVTRNKDAANTEDRMPGDDDRVMNMVLRTDSGVIMASDVPEQHQNTPQGFRLQLEPQSLEEFNRLYEQLGEDAIDISMPVEETFWAERFTMFTDRFGTPWMLNFTGSKG